MRNLEAKFRLADLDVARTAAIALGYAPSANIIQHDTFFAVAHGKLKLREQPPDAWLIHYQRDRESDLMLSHYEIVQVTDARRMREMLARALGVLAEVRKTRTVMLLRHNVRLHLDQVEMLGAFGEIEAVLDDSEKSAHQDSASAVRRTVEELLGALGIRRSELIEVSYFELMARAKINR